MIKKYLYAGLILLIIGVVMLYEVSSYVTTGTPTGITNVTVLHGRIGDVPLRVNATAISIMFVFASNNTDIYFLNQSAFSGLSSYLNASPSGSAYSYVKGLNINSSDMSLNSTSAVKEEYQTSGTPGRYYIYAVIDSTAGSPSYNSVVNASVVYKSYGFGSWETNSIESLIGIAAIILGVGLLIYGAIKKPKAEMEAQAAEPEAPKPKARKKRG
jgi:hypothetical protein